MLRIPIANLTLREYERELVAHNIEVEYIALGRHVVRCKGFYRDLPSRQNLWHTVSVRIDEHDQAKLLYTRFDGARLMEEFL